MFVYTEPSLTHKPEYDGGYLQSTRRGFAAVCPLLCVFWASFDGIIYLTVKESYSEWLLGRWAL